MYIQWLRRQTCIQKIWVQLPLLLTGVTGGGRKGTRPKPWTKESMILNLDGNSNWILLTIVHYISQSNMNQSISTQVQHNKTAQTIIHLHLESYPAKSAPYVLSVLQPKTTNMLQTLCALLFTKCIFKG